MRVAAIRLDERSWTIAPVGAARGRTERASIIVEIETTEGVVGRGEAAPLPGMSLDTLTEARAELAAFSCDAEVASFDDVVAATRGVHAPSARFAVETALLDALAQARGCTIADLIPAIDATVLAPSTVIEGSVPAAPVLKLKVGPGDDVDRVLEVARAAPLSRLRLDANRSWPRERVPAILFALAELPVDYVEEPCADAASLLTEPLPCPIALDESLATMSPDEVAPSPGLAAVVLKPTVLGGFARCLAFAGRGVPTVVTHTLESDIGRAACEQLRLALGRRHARVIVATPSQGTVDAIRGALDAGTPLALLHPRLPADELARQQALVEAAPLPPDTAFVLFTSGSTGPARGVVISRAAVDAACAASAHHLGWRADDRWLVALPMAHAGGLAVVTRCHLAGRDIELLDGDWDRAHAAAALERCTLASLVPTQLASLLDDPAWRPPSRLRAVLLGGAAASPALLDAAAARGVPFLTTYGLTETFGQIATQPLSLAGRPGVRPRLFAGVAVDAGTPDAPDVIHIRAPMLATRYLDGGPIAPALTTADLGFVDEGALHVIGRADDVIISGGEKVHPTVVEAVLTATPGVRAACVTGLTDLRWGHIVGAALVVDTSFDRTAADARWATQLPPHARPREVILVDALPLGPTGKVDRRRVAAVIRMPR